MPIDPDRGPLSQEGAAGVPLGPPGILIGYGVLGFLLRWAWPARIFADPLAGPFRDVGFLGIAAWIGFAVWGVRTFRRVGTSPNPTRPSNALAIDGPYRYTRNPMYLGMMCLMVGLAFALDSLALLVAALGAWFALRFAVIAREERYLEAKFGAPYTEYKARVRRWI